MTPSIHNASTDRLVLFGFNQLLLRILDTAILALMVVLLGCYLLPSPAKAEKVPPASYDVQIESLNGNVFPQDCIERFKESGVPVYSRSDGKRVRLVADINASRHDAEAFVARHCSENRAKLIASDFDVAPNGSVVKTSTYPRNQLYVYVPERDKSLQEKRPKNAENRTSPRRTVRDIASMRPDPESLSASELAGLPPRPGNLSARELLRQSRESTQHERKSRNETSQNLPGSHQDLPTSSAAASGKFNRKTFIAVMSNYIWREYSKGSFDSGLPAMSRRAAAYYAAWIYDAAMLYGLDPFLMVAIPDHETNFMNVNGDWNHFTNGVRNHSEGIFQMLKSTQLAVYNDMKERGVANLISWRPGMDLKDFPRDQAYMAAHFLRFFCSAHPKNYQNALTTYNGSPTYPPKVIKKLRQAKSYFLKQVS